MNINKYPQGSRVRITRGRFPLDDSLVGRVGTVVHLKRSGANKYGIQLDEETRLRIFTEDELEVERIAGSLEEAGEPAGGSGSASPS